MAWPNRDVNYQEEFGVASKEELKARLAKLTQLETDNQMLNTTVTTQSGELNTVKASLAALEGRLTELTTNNNQNNNNNNNNNNNQNVSIPSVTDDENAAFAIRMAPLQESTMENTALILEDRILRRIAAQDPLFSKMENEVRDLLSKTPLAMRANMSRTKDSKTIAEQVIENAYFVVKGRKADQIRTDSIAGKGEFFVEPARSSGNTGNTNEPTEKSVQTLTDEDRRIISKMNIKPETYVKLINDGGPNMGGALVNKGSI